jgi:hypothetical protein
VPPRTHSLLGKRHLDAPNLHAPRRVARIV